MKAPAAGPRVTVIVATYHRGARLRPTLQSLQRQTWTDFEAWICGDACTDDSAAVVAELNDARFHWCNLAQNSGSQAAPNNEGLRRGEADLVAYLGHDDLWFPWHLATLVAALESADAVAAHGLCAWVTPAACTIRGGAAPNGNYRTYFVPPSSLLHRRAPALALGGWRDPDALGLPVDFDFVRRLAAQGKITASERLGTIKFPSAAWRAYAQGAGCPQQDFAARLVADAPGLERELLTTFAARPRTYTHVERDVGVAGRDLRAALRRLWSAVRFDLAERYGRERWPLRGWLRRRWQRQRQEARRGRGL